MFPFFKRRSNPAAQEVPSLSEREKKRMDFDFHFLSDEGNKISIVVSDRSFIVINEKTVYSGEEQIIEVSIGKNTILVATDHPDFHRQLSYSMPLVRQKGNIFAFDTNGTLLWRIEDIVAEFRVAFNIAYIVSDKERADEAYRYNVELRDDHDYCVCATALAEYHLIDMTTKNW